MSKDTEPKRKAGRPPKQPAPETQDTNTDTEDTEPKKKVKASAATDANGWPLNPELQDGRGTKTPKYLRWLKEECPEIYAAKCGEKGVPNE